MWVFGYGSLIWKVDFPVRARLVGHIKGYVRRFYQLSVDHRGVPHRPGRVVTLLPASSKDAVWGVAYDVDPSTVDGHLDFREKNGYTRHTVTFHPCDGDVAPFDLTIYIATPDNVSFAGEADVETIARQVIECQGPSGTNREYVYQLAAAMAKIAPHVKDDHLTDLERAVRRLDEDRTTSL